MRNWVICLCGTYLGLSAVSYILQEGQNRKILLLRSIGDRGRLQNHGLHPPEGPGPQKVG